MQEEKEHNTVPIPSLTANTSRAVPHKLSRVRLCLHSMSSVAFWFTRRVDSLKFCWKTLTSKPGSAQASNKMNAGTIQVVGLGGGCCSLFESSSIQIGALEMVIYVFNEGFFHYLNLLGATCHHAIGQNL